MIKIRVTRKDGGSIYAEIFSRGGMTDKQTEMISHNRGRTLYV